MFHTQVISVLGKTLAPFATSRFIAGYGFGDAKTEDHGVFPLKTDAGFCKSFSQVEGINISFSCNLFKLLCLDAGCL